MFFLDYKKNSHMKKLIFKLGNTKQKQIKFLSVPEVGTPFASDWSRSATDTSQDNCCIHNLHLLRLIKYPPSAWSICDGKLSKLRMDSKARTE